MSLVISLPEIPQEGLQIAYEVEPGQLDLSSDEGEILGVLQCEGVIFPTDDRSASFQGSISGRVLRECVRCLSPFQDSIEVSCGASFRPAPELPIATKKNVHRTKVEEIDLEEDPKEDAFPIVDNHLDLLPVIREQVILATPFQPLCKENCFGLCQRCGANLNEGACGCPITQSETSTVFSLEKMLIGPKHEKSPHSTNRKKT